MMKYLYQFINTAIAATFPSCNKLVVNGIIFIIPLQMNHSILKGPI